MDDYEQALQSTVKRTAALIREECEAFDEDGADDPLNFYGELLKQLGVSPDHIPDPLIDITTPPDTTNTVTFWLGDTILAEVPKAPYDEDLSHQYAQSSSAEFITQLRDADRYVHDALLTRGYPYDTQFQIVYTYAVRTGRVVSARVEVTV